MAPSRELVITADDLGYCRERDEGIIHCYKANAITRSMLMMNGTSTETAAVMAREINMPVGLHLNMTEGFPISKKEDIPSLLDTNGYFLGRLGFPEILAAGHINMDEIVIELTAQVKKFEQLMGHIPPYIDGHHHIHIRPGVAEVFASTLSKLGITWARMPAEDTDHSPWMDAKRMPFFVEVSEKSNLAKHIFSANNIRFTDHYIGMMLMGNNLSVDRIQAALARVFKLKQSNDVSAADTQTGDVSRSCELMVHPGYPCTSGIGGCGEGPDDFAKSTDRLHEMEVLQSESLKEYLKEHNIKLTHFPT